MRYRHIFAAALIGAGILSADAFTPQLSDADNYYLRAEGMYATGIFTGTIDQLNRYLQLLPPVLMESATAEEQASLLRLKAMMQRGELARVHAYTQEFIHDFAGSPLVPVAELVNADAYYFEGRYGQAVNIYESLPFSSFGAQEGNAARFRYAIALSKCGYFSPAQNIFLSLADDPVWGTKSQFYIAYIDYVNRDYNGALTKFRALSPEVARQMGADFYVAQLLFNNQEYASVIGMKEALMRAAATLEGKDSPSETEAWRLIGESYFALGNKGEAETALLQHVNKAGGQGAPTARYILGQMAYNRGNFIEADEWFSPVTAHPGELGQSALLYMGQSAAGRGDYTGAAIYFDRAASMPYDAKVAETALYNYAAAVVAGGRVPFGSASSLLEDFGTRYPNSKYTSAVDRYLAIGYMAEKRYLKALEKLERIKKPTSEVQTLKKQALYELGVSELASGQADQAEYYLRRAAEGNGNDELSTASRLWLAESLYAQKKYKDAAAAYKKYLGSASRNDNNRAQGYYNMAYALYQLGDYKACKTALENALKITGSGALSKSLRTDALLRIADCDNYTGNVKEALKTYTQAASEADSGSADYAALQAACMQGILGDEKAKKAGLETMLLKWPDSPWVQQALYELSQLCLTTRDFKGALEAQSRLEKLAPDSRMLRESKLRTADTYYSAGKEHEAIDIYKQIVKTWPSSTQAVSASDNLQTYYSSRGELSKLMDFLNSVLGAPKPDAGELDRLNYANAVAAVENDADNPTPLLQYLERFPNGRYRADAMWALAQVYRKTRNSAKALEIVNKLLADRAGSDYAPEALLMKAQILQSSGSAGNSAAALAYNELLQRGGAAYAAQAYKGLLETASTPEQAINYADKYLALSSLDEEQRIEGMTLKADALVAAGRSDEALTYLRKLATDSRSSRGGAATVKMARIYLKAGNLREAEKLLTSFTDKGCDDLDQLALGYIALADTYTALGDKRKARQYLEALSKNYPGDNQEILTLIKNGLNALK